jgi:hypothetical protein
MPQTVNWRKVAITVIDPGRPILNECKRLLTTVGTNRSDSIAQMC